MKIAQKVLSEEISSITVAVQENLPLVENTNMMYWTIRITLAQYRTPQNGVGGSGSTDPLNILSQNLQTAFLAPFLASDEF